jgi:hypothetical protein
MNNENNNRQQDAAEQAMNQVLAAERAAEQAVADCEAEARAIIQNARSRALRIDERTNERIAILEQRCSQHTERKLRALRQHDDPPSEQNAPQELDDAGLRSVAKTLALQLVTPDKGGS